VRLLPGKVGNAKAAQAAKKMHWFKFYPDRWYSETFDLMPNEIAAYVVIKCELFMKDGYTTLNIETFARRCRMRPTSFKKAVDALVKAELIELEHGWVKCKSVTEEIVSRDKLRQIAREFDKKHPENSSKINTSISELASYKEERNKKIDSSSSDSMLSGSPFDKQSPARLAEYTKRNVPRGPSRSVRLCDQ